MTITEQETTQELRQNMVLIVSNLCHISSSPYSMSSECISLTQSSDCISLTQSSECISLTQSSECISLTQSSECISLTH